MPYVGEVNQGAKGWFASVSNGRDAFIIHPMGESANREFYSKDVALSLAVGHAAHANAGTAVMDSSSWHRVA